MVGNAHPTKIALLQLVQGVGIGNACSTAVFSCLDHIVRAGKPRPYGYNGAVSMSTRN